MYVVCGVLFVACCMIYDETITDRRLLFTTCMTYDETITDQRLLFTTNESQCWQLSFATALTKRAKISRNDEGIQNRTSQLKPNVSATAAKNTNRGRTPPHD